MVMTVFKDGDLIYSFHPLTSLLDHTSQRVGYDQGEDLWVAGRIHTQPHSRASCSVDLWGLCGADLEIWTAASSGSLKLSQCTHRPICLGPLYKIYYQSRAVCFHLVFYGLCPQHGAARTKQRQTPSSLVLYWTWHTKVQNLKQERAVCCGGGWEHTPQA